MRILLYAGILLLAAFVGFAAALAIGGDSAFIPALFGLIITLPLALATLVISIRIGTVRPDFGPIVILSSAFLRMVWAVLAVTLLSPRAEESNTTSDAIAQWTTWFYLLTLAVETLLLWGSLSKASRAKSPPGDGSTQAG